MAQIINTATVIRYQYPVGDTTKVIDVPISSTAINELVNVAINFTKVCQPRNADIGDLITINYTASNNTLAATPLFSNVNVQDGILALGPSNLVIVSQTNTKNFNSTTGSFDFDLTSVGGTLGPGETITATVTLRLVPGANLTLNYNTVATGTFTEQTTQAARSLTDVCNLQINNGTLVMTKTSSVPQETPVACGQTLTYTTVITNTGNTASTITAGNFSDPIPVGTTYAGSISPINFGFNGSAVVNLEAVTIDPGASLTVSFNVTVNCPVF